MCVKDLDFWISFWVWPCNLLSAWEGVLVAVGTAKAFAIAIIPSHIFSIKLSLGTLFLLCGLLANSERRLRIWFSGARSFNIWWRNPYKWVIFNRIVFNIAPSNFLNIILNIVRIKSIKKKLHLLSNISSPWSSRIFSNQGNGDIRHLSFSGHFKLCPDLWLRLQYIGLWIIPSPRVASQWKDILIICLDPRPLWFTHPPGLYRICKGHRYTLLHSLFEPIIRGSSLKFGL